MNRHKAMIKAIQNDNLDLIKDFINKGLIKASDADNHYILYCCAFGSFECLEFLLSQSNVEIKYNQEDCLIHLVKRKDIDLFKLYYSFGVDPSFDNNTLLKSAFYEKADDIFLVLFKDKRVLNKIDKEFEDLEYKLSGNMLEHRKEITKIKYNELKKIKNHCKYINIKNF